jgi:Fe-S cluster biogenesis protein NfuA
MEDKKMRTHQDIVNDIETILKDKVAPSVAAHSGEIKFISFNEGVVRLLLSGSCSGCAMSKVTLHRGVENMLKHYVPEVHSLVGEDDEKAKDQGYTPYFPKDAEPDWEKLERHKYE